MFEEIKKIHFDMKLNNDISEEDIRQAINHDLKKYIKDNYNKDITFRNEVVTNERKFIDSKYENILIEYKKPSVMLGDKEEKQIINYLKTNNTDAWGILTNGIDVKVYRYIKDNDKIVVDGKNTGKLDDNKLTFIADLLSKKDQVVLTSENIDSILGIEKNKDILRNLLKQLKDNDNNDTIKKLYQEWLYLYNLSDDKDVLNKEKKKEIIDFYEDLFLVKINNSKDEYQALFAIQTYYSLILKLCSLKILQEEFKKEITIGKFIKDFFEDMENNKFFRDYNLSNLVDGDFFSWYLEVLSEKELKNIYNIVNNVGIVKHEDFYMLFTHFYENIFPFHVRHSMGEYYTPYFLADKLFKKTVKGNTDLDKKVLDITCGSGIFLLAAMNNGYKNIQGIDINPLAVLTSKVNYIIFNLKKIKNSKEQIEIPIYLGDTNFIPEETTINNIKCFIFKNDNIEIVLPIDLVNRKDFFFILDNLQILIKQNSISIKSFLESYDEFYYKELKDEYINLVKELKTNNNLIFLKIIGNYLKSGNIKNIDFIVGNPPWVSWSNLPDNYKENIKRTCRIDGLFSSDKNIGGIDLNIAALITHIAIRERLNKDGKASLILPDSFLFNKSYEGFRKMETDKGKFYLNEVELWNKPSEKPFDPVSISFGLFLFSFKENNDIKIYDRLKSKEMIAFQNKDSFNNHFTITSKEDKVDIEQVLGSNKYRFRSGVGLVKGGHYLLEFKEKVDDKHSIFYKFEKRRNRIRRSDETIELEHEIVFPFIKTEDVNNGEIIKTNHYCIFPYEYGSKKPMDLKTIRTKYPKFYKYFMSEEVQKDINTASSYNKRIQNNSFDIGIMRVGEYTYNDYYIVTRDNSSPDFSYVEKIKTDWGETKIPIMDSHISYLTRDLKDKPLTKNETLKLFNIFTQKGVAKYIRQSSDARSISSRLYADIDTNSEILLKHLILKEVYKICGIEVVSEDIFGNYLLDKTSDNIYINDNFSSFDINKDFVVKDNKNYKTNKYLLYLLRQI